MYNLVKRQAEVEILPLAKDQQLGVTPYSPVGAGLLTGKYAKLATTAPARLNDKDYYKKRYEQQVYFATAEKFTAFAGETGYKPAPLAISWAMHHPAVTAPIIGARNSVQLQESLQAVDIDMSAALREQISALSLEPALAHDRLEETIDPSTRLR
jgi:aryl-alcohol dehydrogenase-like predicted oxidoreductase